MEKFHRAAVLTAVLRVGAGTGLLVRELSFLAHRFYVVEMLMCEMSICYYGTLWAGGRLLQYCSVSPSASGHFFGDTVIVYNKGYSFIHTTEIYTEQLVLIKSCIRTHWWQASLQLIDPSLF